MAIEKVRQYYESFDEWSRLDSAAGKLELVRSLALLERYLQPPGRVLDLGGGPGRYTMALARRGFPGLPGRPIAPAFFKRPASASGRPA